MNENFRLFFSLLWLVSVGALCASALAVLISWGDHWEYLFAALVALAVSTVGTVITSL